MMSFSVTELLFIQWYGWGYGGLGGFGYGGGIGLGGVTTVIGGGIGKGGWGYGGLSGWGYGGYGGLGGWGYGGGVAVAAAPVAVASAPVAVVGRGKVIRKTQIIYYSCNKSLGPLGIIFQYSKEDEIVVTYSY